MADTKKTNENSPINLKVMLLWWLAIIAIGTYFESTKIKEIPYSEFLTSLKNNQIQEVRVKGHEIQGALISKDSAGKPVSKAFKTFSIDPTIARVLQNTPNLKFSAEPESNMFSNVINFIVPFFFFWLLVSLFMTRGKSDGGGMGGLLSIGRSRARVYIEEQIGVTFKDVAGVDEAKEELKEIITFLTEPQRYRRLGGKLPKGILLVGPPGTGKTLLAKAVAGEANVPFFSISGSEFVELFVGVGAARVRDLFEQAKAKAPCIIFIDELDALGRARGVSPVTGGHDEKEQTLNQLLAELDGFDTKDGVILLAATNRPEILDPALLRAGRFDRQVLVARPDKAGRVEILKVHLREVKASSSIVIEEIAAMTPGFSGADLANLVNESTLLAARRNALEVEFQDMLNAFERIVAGLEKKNRLLNNKEREVVAYHEMGHALVALALPDSEPVQKVSIIPRGIGALGYTLRRPIEDRFLMSKQELQNKMTVLMGGRAAERIVFNDCSTGAADDFSKATEIARSMVTRYGMVDQVGMVAYMEEQASLLHEGMLGTAYPLSERTKKDLDLAVKTLIQQAYDKAEALLKDRRDALERGARLLLEKETIEEDDLNKLLSDMASSDQDGTRVA